VFLLTLLFVQFKLRVILRHRFDENDDSDGNIRVDEPRKSQNISR
jgi:hypothetical protein